MVPKVECVVEMVLGLSVVVEVDGGAGDGVVVVGEEVAVGLGDVRAVFGEVGLGDGAGRGGEEGLVAVNAEGGGDGEGRGGVQVRGDGAGGGGVVVAVAEAV